MDEGQRCIKIRKGDNSISVIGTNSDSFKDMIRTAGEINEKYKIIK